MARIAAAGAALLVVLVAPRANADDCNNPLVSTCINSDTFWPNPGPTRFAAVGSAETIAAGNVGFGLVTAYQSRPIVVRSASPGTGTEHSAVEDQVNANFLWAYGVTNRLQLDFALPATLGQGGIGGSADSGGPRLRDTALRDLRFGAAYAFVARSRADVATQTERGEHFGVVGRFTVSAPTGDRDQFAGDRTAVFTPAIAADYRRGRYFGGAEVLARLRGTTDLHGGRIGSQAGLGLGVGADVLSDERLAVIGEARALYNFPEQADSLQNAAQQTVGSAPNGKHIVLSEWLFGVRSAPFLAGDVSFLFAGGTAIPLTDSAITQPRFRFVLGLTYAPMAKDSDGDGILDKNDLCPHVHDQGQGTKDGRDGCVHEPEPEPPVVATPPPPEPSPAAPTPPAAPSLPSPGATQPTPVPSPNPAPSEGP